MSGHTHSIPTCREIVDQLPDWAEGQLPEAAEEPYRRHLDLCPPCGDLARTYQALARVARAALEVRMPEAARQRLQAALRARLRGTH